MDILGFVPPVVVAPVVGPIVNFAVMAATTVASVIGIKAAVDAATVQQPQTSVGGDFSFKPWGDDPYESTEEPEPVPAMAPLAESTPAPVPAPAPAPAPVPQKPEQADSSRDPQAPLTPEYTPVPAPATPGTAGRLGGYTFRVVFEPSDLRFDLVLRFGGEYSEKIITSWNAVSYEVDQLLINGQWAYKARIRVMNGSTTKHLWVLPDVLPRVPDTWAFGATASFENFIGETETLTIDQLAKLGTGYKGALGKPLVKTFVPKQLPAYTPKPLTEPKVETETETELDELSNPWPLPAPVVFPNPLAPPDSVPLPLTPETLPQLNSEGRPVLPQRPVITLPGTHVIITPGGTIPVGGDGVKATLQGIAKEVKRVEGKSAQLLKNTTGTGDLINKLPALLAAIDILMQIFERPLPSEEFSISAVCDEPLEDGSQPRTTVILPKEKWADRLISQSTVVPDLLQAHLGYKTPTCGSSKVPLEGDWVTTRWLSDEKMDHSGRRLRKLFRYRSQSTRDLVELSSYWECFSWRSGPVCVRHTGSWWGDPQVWAESAEEGKRVIRHAAAEAGIDPDQTGRWAVSGSRSPRYGMSGTMRIHVHKGFPWVASRDGASWPNYLAKQA
jgi:hypothetical protein